MEADSVNEQERRHRGGAHRAESAGSSSGETSGKRRREQTQYLWKPQEDITAFELAQCMPVLIMDDFEIYDRLPDECKRHWKVRP